MPRAIPVPVGTQFARLVSISEPYRAEDNGPRMVGVRCACGTVLTVRAYRLVSGRVKSCGCLKREQSSAWGLRPENPLRRRGKDSVRYKLGGRQDKTAWLLNEKSLPCTDCGVGYHFSVMQFDHVPSRGNKSFEINARTINKHGLTLDALIEERTKCDLVCANCHAYRTWTRHYQEES